MRDVIVLLLVVVTVLLIGGLTLSAVGLWWLRFRNRVGRHVPSDAPLHWLWSPTPPARLHRRLRAAVRISERAVKRSKALAPVSAELVDQAVVTDADVVVASRLARAQRRGRLTALTTHVDTIEQLALRVSELAHRRELALPADGRGALEALEERIDLVEQAHDELRRLEGSVGR